MFRLHPSFLRSAHPEQDRERPFLVYTSGQGSVRPPGARPRLPQNWHTRYAIEFMVVLAAYFLGGELGLAVPLTSGNVSPIWPPAGIALAAFLLLGYRVWPAIALGAFLVNFFSPIPHIAAFGIAAGNTLGPLAGTWFLRRKMRGGFDVALCRFQDVLKLVLLGGLVGTAISAVIGTTALFTSGVSAWSHFGAAYFVWWFGDALGVLILSPLFLLGSSMKMPASRHRRELGALFVGATAVTLLIFGTRIGVAVGTEILVLVSFVLWAALRFELAGTVALNALIAAIAVWNTSRGLGPLSNGRAFWSAALLQSFLFLVAVPGMILASALAERARTVRQQAAQLALKQSERRYGSILETANEPIWMLDAQFRTHFVNHRMAELLGYTVEEMIGRSLFDFVFAEDVERKKASLERRRSGISEQVRNRYRCKDGSELWALVSTAPIMSPENGFEGAIKWFIPEPDNPRGEAEQTSALELITLLWRAVQQTTDSVMITDSSGIIEYVNPAFEAITGYTQDEAVGKTPRIVKSGRQGTEFYKELWNCISNGTPFQGTLINRRKSGELYWGEQTIVPVADDNGNITHHVSVVRDVTDSHEKQEQEVQLRLAREVQQRFYTQPASIPGIDFEVAAYPADQTGGDYFDLIPMPDDSLYVGAGDVSGHGLGSALVMALTRAYIRSFADLNLGLTEILTRVNRMLMADLERDQYATLLLTRISPQRDSLLYASAGHIPGVLLNCHGQVEHLLESTACPLGILDSCDFPVKEVSLKPHQMLVLMTDGITECATVDDQEFGTERAIEYITDHCRDSVRDLAHGLCDAARKFSGAENQHDDLTAVVLRVR